MSGTVASLVDEEEKYIVRIRKRAAAETSAEDDENDASSSTSEETASDHDDVEAPSTPLRKASNKRPPPLSPVAVPLQEEMKAGTVLVRSLAHFEILDSQLREEVLGSTTASVGEDGVFLPLLPKKTMGSLVKPLEEYLDSVLRIPAAVRSDALATFLTTVDTPMEEDDARQQHMYHDYLLPHNNMKEEDSPYVPEFHTIPRLGPFNASVKVLPPGWWVVWQFHIESGIAASVSHSGQVEFSVYIDQPSEQDTDEGEGESDTRRNLSDLSLEEHADISASSDNPKWRELVHREVCSSEAPQPFTGSYRFSPDVSESASALLQFSNVGSLSLLGGCRVQLQCAAVPHEAFRAACEAARAQNEADARRHRAPLLYSILYSTDHENESGGGIHLSVESFYEQTREPSAHESIQTEDAKEKNNQEPEEDDDDEQELSANEFSSLIVEKDEQLKDLRTEVAQLHKDRDHIRAELARITQLADDGKRKLQLMVSEKRVWSVAREEIQMELSRLSEELAAERQAKNNLTVELEESKQEAQQLRGEVKLLECSAPTEEDENRQKEILETAQSAVDDMRSTVADLETRMESLKSKNAALEATIEKQKKNNKDRLLRARAELDESKMYQRVLEGKVRHLEQELRRSKDSGSSRKKGNKKVPPNISVLRATPCRSLDPKCANFQHPDERLNKQLNSLRERHAKLVLLLNDNPNNAQNMELIGKIEKAIHDIVANAANGKPSQASSS